MSEKKSKTIGKFFKNLIYESTEESTGESVDSSEELDNINVSNSGTNNYAPVDSAQNLNIPTSGDGVFDQKFNDSFQELIEQNNIPGIDYFEFRQAIAKMSAVAGLNEAASFQTAFTTLKFGDPALTKEKLLSSVDHYIHVLAEEEGEFNSELQSQTNSEVISKRQKAQALNDENQELVNQITAINEKIRKNQEEAIKLNSEASSAEANIGQTSKNFIKTLAHVTSTLETDKTKISTLITE